MNADSLDRPGEAAAAAGQVHSDSPAPTVRVAVAVVELEGRYLIGRRPTGTALEGLWEFPGGKVQAGESIDAAAVRECLEETGVEIEVQSCRPGLIHEYAHARVELFFLACWPIDPRHVPAAPFVWVPRSELARYEFPAANAALIRDIVSGTWPT